MIFEDLKLGLEVADRQFDALYPKQIRPLAEFHFTPVAVAKTAAQFLAEQPGTKVLDIGSGAGKFCLIGSVCTAGHFTGVEQREYLHGIAARIAAKYHLPNLNFIRANITEIALQEYDAFYYFNSFYENIDTAARMDDAVRLERQLYWQYALYVRAGLDAMPAGTRLVTYFSYLEEIPASYKIQALSLDGKLKMWQKAS